LFADYALIALMAGFRATRDRARPGRRARPAAWRVVLAPLGGRRRAEQRRYEALEDDRVRRLPRVRPDVLATRRDRADAEAEGQARQDQAATCVHACSSMWWRSTMSCRPRRRVTARSTDTGRRITVWS